MSLELKPQFCVKYYLSHRFINDNEWKGFWFFLKLSNITPVERDPGSWMGTAPAHVLSLGEPLGVKGLW